MDQKLIELLGVGTSVGASSDWVGSKVMDCQKVQGKDQGLELGATSKGGYDV